ncbi:hypothetical protein DFP72DRAFT_228642 [Ephemerocybe angulata]|uniref:Uncharacterized protein n=1 Tax=Ephemerocybe angulata TaxID=980116 RepID=A0A8H6LT77_9AGAR|nr:hypothetical protein DFP72DRAFT_228642 [Tulosesus angulatus]
MAKSTFRVSTSTSRRTTQVPDSLTFEIQLTQFIAVGLPIARTIQCLEATSANPADVYLYNIAYVARLKEVLVTCRLPSHVCEQIRKIINRRWKGFFVTGSSNAHLAAFYLHPAYVRSDIFHNANALSFSINLPARSQDESVSNKVPPGIRSPKTFIEVGKYLHRILLIEVQHGNDPYLSKWKRQLGALVEAFQTQFTAYAQALRNRQRVPTVIATSQVAGFYSKPRKQRRSARPNPTLRFYDIEKLRRRGLDDDERDADPNYDESDDETELRVPRPADSNDSKEDGLTLPEESNGDINLASVEVREILADGPIAPEAGGEKATVVVSGRVKGGEGATRDDEDFELKPWA